MSCCRAFTSPRLPVSIIRPARFALLVAGVEWLLLPNFPEGMRRRRVEVVLTAPEVMTRDNFSSLFDLLPIGAYRTHRRAGSRCANQALVRLNGYATGGGDALPPSTILAVSGTSRQTAATCSGKRWIPMASCRTSCPEVYRHKPVSASGSGEHAHVVVDAEAGTRYYEGTGERYAAASAARAWRVRAALSRA